MRFYRANRISRVYFIYHYGFNGGFWDQRARSRMYAGHQAPGADGTPPGDFAENIRRTYEAAGDFLPAAVRAARAEGLPCYAVLKPYETGLHPTFPHGSPEAREFGRIPRLDGMMWWAPHFTARNPHLRTERDLRDVPPDIERRRIRTIRLTAEPGLPRRLDPARIRLWTSPDNGPYEPYHGQLEVRAECDDPQTIVLDRIETPHRFVALTVDGDPTCSFGNTLPGLVEVRDHQGRVLPITFGQMSDPRTADFRAAGFAFDITPMSASIQQLDDYCWLDGPRPLGLALGRERYLQGELCEACPEVREWWLAQVENCLEAGVAGIDFRIVHHNRAYDWTSFGFNAPLVEAFKARYGVDMLREPFDYGDLRRLRGEFYTDFLRAARQRLNAAGRGMQLHVSARMKSPEWHSEMEVHFDWPTWLREGLADEVTVKMQSVRGEIAPEVAAAARTAGMKVNACPYLNGMPRHPRGPDLARHVAHDALAGGADGFIMYENAAFMAAQEDGAVTITQPWLVEALREHARD